MSVVIVLSLLLPDQFCQFYAYVRDGEQLFTLLFYCRYTDVLFVLAQS